MRGRVRVFCVSDTHGHLPPIPEGIDLVVHAGDMCQQGDPTALAAFPAWLAGRSCVAVDGPPERERKTMRLDLGVRLAPAGVRELRDETIVWQDRLRMCGLSWRGFPEQFDEWDVRCAELARSCDVLVVHQPPGDQQGHSASLMRLIQAVQPLLVVCGHMHEARGVTRVGRTLVVNCAVQRAIKPSDDIHQGFVVEIDRDNELCGVWSETEEGGDNGARDDEDYI
jgi:predicted phosphodiesterase